MSDRILNVSMMLLAQAANGEEMTSTLLRHLVAAVVFSVVGIIVLAVSFYLIHRLTPFSVLREIEEDQNVALAILVASVIIGMSLIIAAAIQG